MLNRESFLAVRPLIKQITIEGLGDVYLKQYSAGTQEALGAEWEKSHKSFRTKVIVASVCDEDGALLFTRADIAQIEELPGDVLDRLMVEINGFNGIGPEAIEDMRKNS